MLRTSAAWSSSGICRIMMMTSSFTPKFTSTHWRGWAIACDFSFALLAALIFFYIVLNQLVREMKGFWKLNYKLCLYHHSQKCTGQCNNHGVVALVSFPTSGRRPLCLCLSVAESEALSILGTSERKIVSVRPCYLLYSVGHIEQLENSGPTSSIVSATGCSLIVWSLNIRMRLRQ